MDQEAPVGLPQPKQSRYTIEAWATWEGRWELIHGEAFAMTAPSPEHQRVSRDLAVSIHGRILALRTKVGGGSCEVLTAPLDLYLPDEQSVYQPDLVVVCDPAKITARGIEGAPDLVVEILSPSTASRDMAKKRWAYEAAGIPEYLLVDPEDRWGLLLRLEQGRYQEVFRTDWGGLLPLLGGSLPVTLGTPAEGPKFDP